MNYQALPSNPIVFAIRALYGIAVETSEYVEGLLESMKKSPNRTIQQAGCVIEAAKFGFGIGFVTPIAIIAIGQMILGHPFAAVATIVTSPVNPVALTCAALGAICYGWGALSEEERNGIIDRIREGLEVGVELVKAIVSFVIAKANELLGSEAMADFKRFIGDAANLFGRTLADVTRAFKDRAAEAYDYVAEKLMRTTEDEPPKLPRLPL